MSPPRYDVVEVEGFDSTHGRVRVYRVKRADVIRYQSGVDVWVAPPRRFARGADIRCCSCSTTTVAMSASCHHVAAVKRWLARTPTIAAPPANAGST